MYLGELNEHELVAGLQLRSAGGKSGMITSIVWDEDYGPKLFIQWDGSDINHPLWFAWEKDRPKVFVDDNAFR